MVNGGVRNVAIHGYSYSVAKYTITVATAIN